MTSWMLSLLAVGVLTGGVSNPEAQLAPHEFVGLWRIEPIAPPGTTGEAQFVGFRPDYTYTTYAEDNAELWSGTFSLDSSASPKVWDHRSYGKREEDPGYDILGVFETVGHVIRVSVTVGRWDGDTWMGPLLSHKLQEKGLNPSSFVTMGIA